MSELCEAKRQSNLWRDVLEVVLVIAVYLFLTINVQAISYGGVTGTVIIGNAPATVVIGSVGNTSLQNLLGRYLTAEEKANFMAYDLLINILSLAIAAAIIITALHIASNPIAALLMMIIGLLLLAIVRAWLGF